MRRATCDGRSASRRIHEHDCAATRTKHAVPSAASTLWCWRCRCSPRTSCGCTARTGFDLPYSIDPFRNYQWLLLVIMPFGPILLDLQGFYRRPSTRAWEIVHPDHAHDDLSRHSGECLCHLSPPAAGQPGGAVALSFSSRPSLLLIKEPLVARRDSPAGGARAGARAGPSGGRAGGHRRARSNRSAGEGKICV